MKVLKLAVMVAITASCVVANAAIVSSFSKSEAASKGWTVVYQGGYAEEFNYAAVLASIAQGSQVALASSASNGALNFDLFGDTTLSTLQTITGVNQTVYADGNYWYRNSNSVGFAPNAVIAQMSADTVGANWGYHDSLNDGALRLSWHGGQDRVTWGWRSGLNTDLSNNVWQRYVLVKQASDVPEPASLALIGVGLAGLAARRRKKAA